MVSLVGWSCSPLVIWIGLSLFSSVQFDSILVCLDNSAYIPDVCVFLQWIHNCLVRFGLTLYDIFVGEWISNEIARQFSLLRLVNLKKQKHMMDIYTHSKPLPTKPLEHQRPHSYHSLEIFCAGYLPSFLAIC